MRRAVVGAAALALAAGAGVAVWALVFRDGSEPVSVQEAVESFRAGEGGGPPVSGPAPGVYVYATRGREEIDVLVGSSHDYPAETTITVAAGGCGILLRWAPLSGRSTTWELCPEGEGWRLAGYRETHTFFGQTERTDYRCAADADWLPAGGAPPARSCTTGETDETSRVEVLGPGEPMDVGGVEVEVVHVRVALTLSGRTRGTGLLEAWLLQNGLPARLVLDNDNRSSSPIGDVRYTEEAELRLGSLEPRR